MKVKDERVQKRMIDDSHVRKLLDSTSLGKPARLNGWVLSPAALGGLTLSPGGPASQFLISVVRLECPYNHPGSLLHMKVPDSHFQGSASVSLGKDLGICILFFFFFD